MWIICRLGFLSCHSFLIVVLWRGVDGVEAYKSMQEAHGDEKKPVVGTTTD